VPVYKGQDFVQETLRSIQRPEHAAFRVCISIDGDDQVSAEACVPFLRDPRFEMFVQQRQLGWAGNLNWLMDRCDCDFFCFWQQDDLAATSYLSRLLSHAAREPDTACVFSDVQWFGTRIDRVETPSLTGFALERVLQQIERGYYAPFFGLVPAAVLDRVGHVRLTPHDSPLEDQVWLATLVAQGPWHRVPGTLYFKRGHTAETHLEWEVSTNDAFRRLTWLEWGAGMLGAAMSASAPQEHGKLFDIVFDRLTTAREGRSLFYDLRSGGVEAFEAFRDDFTSLVRQRVQVRRDFIGRGAEAALYRTSLVGDDIAHGEAWIAAVGHLGHGKAVYPLADLHGPGIAVAARQARTHARIDRGQDGAGDELALGQVRQLCGFKPEILRCRRAIDVTGPLVEGNEVQSGDVVVEIDGASALRMNLEDVSALLSSSEDVPAEA
jgi:hypothetical protein